MQHSGSTNQFDETTKCFILFKEAVLQM